MRPLLNSYIILLFLLACQPRSGKNEPLNDTKEKKSVIKPPTIFSDTLRINSRTAVFYYPDSNQLKKIKDGLGADVFDAVTHEYFYQFKYVHSVLKQYWPGINVVEAKNARYLLFVNADKSNKIIDLDTKYDLYGLFVFEPGKTPTQLELTNAESEISFYFSPEQNK